VANVRDVPFFVATRLEPDAVTDILLEVLLPLIWRTPPESVMSPVVVVDPVLGAVVVETVLDSPPLPAQS
jgi:hypothetical protein